MPRKPKVPNSRKPITMVDENDTIPFEEVPENVPVIDVAENESKPPSLKDRFFSTFETIKEPPKRARVSKAAQNDLIAKAMPTVFTAFIVQLSKNMVPEQFRQACPTKEEVQAILSPFFSILSRRIKVSVGASQDAIDILACLTASIAYGTRALITVEIIKKEKKEDDRRAVSREDNRFARDTISETPIIHDHAHTQNGDTSNSSGETELFSELFRRDVDGRRQMGLLDRGL